MKPKAAVIVRAVLSQSLPRFTWLFTSITDDVLDVSVKDEQCAYELWVRIASHFTANQASLAIYLRNEFHGVTQGTSSITDYYARQKTTADALRAVGHPVQESDLVLNTLRGLNATSALPPTSSPSPSPCRPSPRLATCSSPVSSRTTRADQRRHRPALCSTPHPPRTLQPRRPMEVAVAARAAVASPVARRRVARHCQTAPVVLLLRLARGSA
jgi:hypothetical protein